MYVNSRQSIADITERIPHHVLAVGNLWESGLRNLNIFEAGANHDDGNAILHIKLEIEKLRLFFWGEGVYLADLYDQVYSSYPALERGVSQRGCELLGRLRGVFENTDALERDYGLRQASNSTSNSHFPIVSSRAIGSPTSPIFKRAYGKLMSSAVGYYQQPGEHKATKWVIINKKKFLGLIAEIKNLNDNLHSLKEYMGNETMRRINEGIRETRDVEILKVLQKAIEGDYEEVSKTITTRLKELGMPSDGEELDELSLWGELTHLSMDEETGAAAHGLKGGKTLQISHKVDSMGERLCYSCENTVRINDGQLGSIMRNEDGSEKFEYTKINSNNQPYKPGSGSLFPVIDDLPELPRLKAKGDGPFGCGFCRFLRRCILENCSNEKEKRQRLKIELDYVFNNASTPPGPFALKATLSPDSILYPRLLLFPLVADGDCAEWLGLEPPIRHALDDRSVDTLLNAVTEFQPSFKSTAASSDNFVPTRLIEIRPDTTTSENPSLRLVLKEDFDQKAVCDREIQYAALSYCWGSALEAATQAVTKQDTLRQRRHAIPEEELTPVIIDTVITCRALNIRYLWVDALCIIQDSVSDWEMEAPKMAQVYGNAYLTICPVASTSCHQGFLRRDPTDYAEIWFESVLQPHVNGSYRLWQAIPVHASTKPLNPYQVQGALLYSRWSTRGWTFQEFQSANRLLFFGGLRSYLVASGTVVTELGCKENLEGSLDIPHWDQIVEIFKGEDNITVYNMWIDIVGGYTGRQFTHQKDILPALSGVAQIFSRRLNDRYKAGLWNADLPRQLLWQFWTNDRPIPTLSEHNRTLGGLLDFLSDAERCPNPSWSWSSRPVHTSYGALKYSSIGRRAFLPQETVSLEARTMIKGNNPFGIVSRGELLITSSAIRLDSEIWQKVKKHESDYRRNGGRNTPHVNKYERDTTTWDVFMGNDVEVELHFDCVFHESDLDTYEILLILVGNIESSRYVYSETRGLIVCPSLNTSQHAWVRIGVFKCSGRRGGNGWADVGREAEIKALTII